MRFIHRDEVLKVHWYKTLVSRYQCLSYTKLVLILFSKQVIFSNDGCGKPGAPGKGCWSNLGRQASGSHQCLNLDEPCLVKRLIVHELLHTMGKDREYHISMVSLFQDLPSKLKYAYVTVGNSTSNIFPSGAHVKKTSQDILRSKSLPY